MSSASASQRIAADPRPLEAPPEPGIGARTTPRPCIVVTGDSNRADTVERLLTDIPFETHREPTTLDTLKDLRPATRAIVLVAPLPIFETETAVEILSAHDPIWDAPIVTVLSEGEADGSIGERLLQLGATRVLAWPRDALRLGDVVRGATGGGPT